MVIALTGSEVKTSPLRGLGLVAPLGRDGSHKTMSRASCPPLKKPLASLTSALQLISRPLCCHVLPGGAERRLTSPESSRRPVDGPWMMAFSSPAWGPTLFASNLIDIFQAPTVRQTCMLGTTLPRAHAWPPEEDAESTSSHAGISARQESACSHQAPFNQKGAVRRQTCHTTWALGKDMKTLG